MMEPIDLFIIKEDEEDDEELHQEWLSTNNSLKKHITLFESKLKDIFQQQENEFLLILSRHPKPTRLIKAPFETLPLDVIYAFNTARAKETMRNVATNAMKPIVRESGLKTTAKFGSQYEFNETAPEVLAQIDKWALKLAGEVNKSTLDAIKNQLRLGIKEGEGTPELAKRIKGVFGEASNTRAKLIAETESYRAYNGGQVLAWKQTRVVVGKEWYTARDERTCPICAKKHGSIEYIDDSFLPLGETETGTDGSTFTNKYADVNFPPIHPRCRCVLKAVTRKMVEDGYGSPEDNQNLRNRMADKEGVGVEPEAIEKDSSIDVLFKSGKFTNASLTTAIKEDVRKLFGAAVADVDVTFKTEAGIGHFVKIFLNKGDIVADFIIGEDDHALSLTDIRMFKMSDRNKGYGSKLLSIGERLSINYGGTDSYTVARQQGRYIFGRMGYKCTYPDTLEKVIEFGNSKGIVIKDERDFYKLKDYWDAGEVGIENMSMTKKLSRKTLMRIPKVATVDLYPTDPKILHAKMKEAMVPISDKIYKQNRQYFALDHAQARIMDKINNLLMNSPPTVFREQHIKYLTDASIKLELKKGKLNDKMEVLYVKKKEVAKTIFINFVNPDGKKGNLQFKKVKFEYLGTLTDQEKIAHEARTEVAVGFINSIFRKGKVFKDRFQVLTSSLDGSRTRAACDTQGKKILMEKRNDVGTYIHEIAHAINTGNKHARDDVYKFFKRRTKKEVLEKLKDLHPNSGYDDSEKTYKDKFIDTYMGKFYGEQHTKNGITEVLSMGLQHLYNNPLSLADRDFDMFSMLVKLLVK